jgi:hypothetical protein
MADFEDVQLSQPASALLINSARNSISYSPEPSPLEDCASEHQASGAINTYRQSITHAFLDKCKLPPLISRATNASSAGPYTPPSSGPSSPIKTRPDLFSSNSNLSNHTTTTASRASTRAKAASQNLFDSFFNGASSQLNIGILPTSPSRLAPDEEQQDRDTDEMEVPFTRSPPKSSLTNRPRRSSTARSSSSTVGGRLGGWFSGARAASAAKPSAPIAPEDPLINISISNALFPHGGADPLDPTSFHDLLSSAEALCSTFQSAYKNRCGEIQDLHAEAAVHKDEVDEAETRARHLKMQLDGMAAQLAAQERKADMLERMLEEERTRRRQPEEIQEVRRTSIRLVRNDEEATIRKRSLSTSDSGFESEGESDSSANNPQLTASEREAEKVKVLRVQRGDDALYQAPTVPSCRKCTGPLNASAFGNADLRNENQQLKHRIIELEIAVDGCMEMVSNPWR